MPAVAEQFAEMLAAAGAKRIYGIVGDSLNGLTDAIRKQGRISTDYPVCPFLTALNQRRSKMLMTILGALLIIVPAIQMASASEHHARRAHAPWDFRGSYNRLNRPSIDELQERRNIENFGFSGRDPSRPGGWDPSLNPPS
jgi:hypothetical protein